VVYKKTGTMGLLRNTKSQAEFTLIELLVVIAVIGLLASVLLVSLNNTRVTTRNTKRIGDALQIGKGIKFGKWHRIWFKQ
jgi:prepilin-type N-terminal cleavage/methylation domain-containing protein